MKKILIVLALLCLLFFTACNNTEDIESIFESDSETENEKLWRGDRVDIVDEERKDTPDLNDVTNALLGKKMKDIVDILGKAQDMGSDYGYPLNPITVQWYLDNSPGIEITFVYKPPSTGANEDFNLYEKWMNYGVAIEITISDEAGVIEQYALPPLETYTSSDRNNSSS